VCALWRRSREPPARRARTTPGAPQETSPMSVMNIHQILKRLPHRYPILLVDRVLELEPHQRIRALKNVSINEQFFVGHFPHRPVMPGVLTLEALAQAAALLAFESAGSSVEADSVVYFVGIDGARFKRPVEPGDQLILEASIDRMKAGIYKFKTRASVDGETVVEADLMCTLRKVR
jgi:3-hydroxyacyl-[acyl-carrier-protein] dehydratase